ncbi:mucin-2-like isoform X2 [Branchiostoma floridae]|nr:mucin-2-like isoform X2 [Branchiostoma floridae]
MPPKRKTTETTPKAPKQPRKNNPRNTRKQPPRRTTTTVVPAVTTTPAPVVTTSPVVTTTPTPPVVVTSTTSTSTLPTPALIDAAKTTTPPAVTSTTPISSVVTAALSVPPAITSTTQTVPAVVSALALPPANLDPRQNALAAAILDSPLPTDLPANGQPPHTSSSPPTTASLDQTVNNLLLSSLAPSTLRAYRLAWQQLRTFALQLNGQDTYPPVPTKLLSHFIASLHQNGSAPATITSKLSAIGFLHKLLDLPDPTQSFLIQKLLIAIRKHRTPDGRIPISPTILKSLIDSLPILIASHYDQLLFKAMFLFAFYAMTRISEITTTPNSQHTLHLANLHIPSPAETHAPITVTFSTFKHSTPGQPASIAIQPQPGNLYCPVSSILEYLSLRGNRAGCLFLRSDGNPVSQSYFTKTLKRCVTHVGLDTHNITPHSFRIGAATHAAQQGVPDHLLRSLGRWSSSAYVTYVRP